jgi:plastocyanin
MPRFSLARPWRGLLLSLGLASVLWLPVRVGLPNQFAAPQHADHQAGVAAAPNEAVLAAADVLIELSGFTFSPTVVTIEPGQTVTWVRRDGFHNVAADDGSYRSGDVSGDWATFSHTFDTVGESLYYCEQHGGPGGSGMAGKVIVQASGQGEQKLYLPLLRLAAGGQAGDRSQVADKSRTKM